MYRRILSAIALIFTLAFSANAQQMTFDQFRDTIMSYKGEFNQYAAVEHDYAKSIVPLKKMISLYESVEITDAQDRIDGNMLRMMVGPDAYDLACCYARIGKKKLAIEALRKAVDCGWANYGNLMWDINENDLVSIAKDKEVKKIIEEVRLMQPLAVLQRSGAYQKEDTDTIPAFRYQPATDHNLTMVREYFKLDSVAGTGDELSKIKNILGYCHNLIRHDGSNFAFAEMDAIDLYHYHKVTGKGINCLQLATVLMEMYLAEGFKARLVSCVPMDKNDYDSHVINCVWSETLHKWLYVDPTMNAWVTDENGTMLSIAEVRERLIDGRPLNLNEEANWNNENKQTKEYYLETYMAKNLYVILCPLKCMFNSEPRYRNSTNNFLQLVPSGFDYYTHANYTTSDPEIFWQAPE